MERWILVFVCVFLAACRAEPDVDSTSKDQSNNTAERWVSPVGSIPAYEQRDGDPVKGRYALLHNDYVNCGIPERVFREALASNPGASVAAVLPDRDASSDGLPFNVNRVIGRTGTPVVSSNCLTCHGTELFGEVVIGLGNEFADFTQDPRVGVERLGALVRGDDEIAEWERFADRVSSIAPYVQMNTVGVNPANNLTFALITHRDRASNAWLTEPDLPSPLTSPPPVSVPPWWRMNKKHALFNLGEGRGDHARIMLAASMMCADTIDELNAIDAYAPDVRAFLSSIEPPAYPFPIDPVLADSGESVFNQTCSQCHGSYGDTPSYPNQIVPIDVVNTDSELMNFALSDQGQQYAKWFSESWYGELSSIEPAAGYVAPPLDGIWATAPFLHNGSVPTVRQLLDSKTRVTQWRHSASHANDPSSYDQRNLGWNHESLPTGVNDSSDPIDKRRYDTSRTGYGNAGHTFGDGLSEAERTAVIEYLKTL